MPTIAFTVRVNSHLKQNLEKMADLLDRPRSWVVNQALERYMLTEEAHIEELQRRVKEANAGEFASEREVANFFSSLKDED